MTAPGDRRDMRPVQSGRRCCRDLLILRLVGADQTQKGAYVGRTALGARTTKPRTSPLPRSQATCTTTTSRSSRHSPTKGPSRAPFLCSPRSRFRAPRYRAAPAGDAPLAAPLHLWAAHLLASARTARPAGSLCRPWPRASGFRALRAPGRRPRLFYRCAQKQLGAPALLPSHSRRAADRSAAPTPSRDAPAKPRTTRECGGWWRFRRSCLAPSRRRPPGAAAVPSPAAPPLAPGGSLRRGRSALISPLPSANPRDRGTGALADTDERTRS